MTASVSSKKAETQSRLLDSIASPADVKALPEEDLPQLAQEVREELIKVLSQTGGHLGPNDQLSMTQSLTEQLSQTPLSPKKRLKN